MIRNPVFIILALIAIEAMVLGFSRYSKTKFLFDFLPPVFWIYFLPMLSATFGLIPSNSPVYGMITAWLLPASLILLLLPVDMRAILRLGPKALSLFFIGAAGIIAGTALSFALFKPWIGAEFWAGFGALSASWTGGSANMIAVKEALTVPDSVFAPMVIVDTVVPYVWMGLLIAAAGYQPIFDRWNSSDHSVMDRLGEDIIMTDGSNRRTSAGTALSLAIAFAGSGLAHAIAEHLPQIKDVVSGYTWTILIVSVFGILLSITPARNLEKSGASRTGYEMLYFVLTAIGAKASIADFGSAITLIGAGLIIVFIHAALLLAAARLLHAPLSLVAAASQANIGGAASAPVVAEVYHQGLASVGLLLAILGNIVGTWLGIIAAQLCRLI